jgi:tetratricopeptide (TPR) repeat protein
MSLDILQVEKALLRGKWATQSKNNQQPSSVLAEAVVSGRFRDVLTSPSALDLFHIKSPTLDQPLDQLFIILPATTGEEELMRLVVAVACLHAFLQVNWTGPDLDVRPLEVITLEAESSLSLNEDVLNEKAISELAYGGEPAYHLTKVAAFLRLAQILLDLPYNHCQTISWWKLRTSLVHQQLLDELVPPSTPPASIGPLKTIFSSEPDLLGQLILEQGLVEHQITQDKSAAELFVQAAKTTGLEYMLTGALGKRTKFQQTDLSQLVLLAESHLVDDDQTSKSTSDTVSDLGETRDRPKVPDTLALNDDTLLEQTEFTSSNPSHTDNRLSHIDPSSQPPLHPLDQCILLSLCLNVKNTSPSHGLTSEQMAPYVARVISHPRNWSVHTMALLLRSRLEASRTRTAERSTLQLQALIDQMPTADSALSERLLYFHSIPLPSKWEMERELAMRFLSLGVVRSALEIFERLEMWEEVVKCWGSLERRDKAIAIVRDLLEGRKAEADEVLSRGKATSADRRQIHDNTREAKLWCILGDLEPEHAVDHYKHAWAISKETSGRAMRSLGGHYFARGQFGESISCLKRAVAINPLLSRSWFILGCAYMREELWEEAKNAFSRCVAIDEEDGESWNNLASMYLRMGTVGKKVEESSYTDNQVWSAWPPRGQGANYAPGYSRSTDRLTI